jgi:hypothetical protein
MYAILKSNSSDVVADRSYCCHLSEDVESANRFVDERAKLSSQGVYTMVQVDSIEELMAKMMPESEQDEQDDLVAELLQKLDDLGLTPENAEKFTKQVQEQSEKAIAEVRSLGIRGMKAVGDGFIAFGDLLRKAAKEDKPEE